MSRSGCAQLHPTENPRKLGARLLLLLEREEITCKQAGSLKMMLVANGKTERDSEFPAQRQATLPRSCPSGVALVCSLSMCLGRVPLSLGDDPCGHRR